MSPRKQGAPYLEARPGAPKGGEGAIVHETCINYRTTICNGKSAWRLESDDCAPESIAVAIRVYEDQTVTVCRFVLATLSEQTARRFSDVLFAIYFPECVEMFGCDAGSNRSKVVQKLRAAVQRVDPRDLRRSQGRRNV